MTRQAKDGRAARRTRWVGGSLALGLLVACGSPAPSLHKRIAPAVRVEPTAEVAPDAGPPDTGLAPDAGVDAGLDAGVRVARTGRFFDHVDRPIRTALANGAIAEVERGHGGRSLGFKITLADGTIGYFKPAQAFTGMRWYAELAAFALDRELGLGRVAPSVGRRVAWSELEAAAGDDARVEELEVDEDGTLPGAFIFWVPERLRPLPLPEGWEAWLRIEGDPPEVSPFQRPGVYRRSVDRRSVDRSSVDRSVVTDATATDEPSEPIEAPEPDRPERPAELSDMMVFDYLTQNVDRWGTNNTNVRTVGEGGPLMYLDNAASFTLRRPRVPLMDARLAQVQRFRRATIDAVRALDVERFAERLADEPLGPLLDEDQLANLEIRRRYLLDYVDGLVATHGEAEVYAW